MTTTKPVLGLVGGIGAGKSTAAQCLAKLGGHIIDCDKLGHHALEDPAVKPELIARWGTGILRSDGKIDRAIVAERVFAEPAERHVLEALVFPVIGSLTAATVTKADENPDIRFHVLDAAVLLEAGWHTACNKVLYIDAPAELRQARLTVRHGWSPAAVAAREAAQWSAERKKSLADAIVTNDGPVSELAVALERLVIGWGW